MSKQVRRRYNFVLRDIPNRKEYLLKNYFEDGEEFGRENYLLSSIDEITLAYKDESELLEDIKIIYGFNFKHSKLYIKYRQNKEDRYLKIAYNELNVLKQFAKQSKSKIKDCTQYKQFYNHVMSNIHKGPFYRYMMEKHYINKRLKKLLDEYLYENKIYKEKEIYEHMKNYRVIRDYIYGVNEYNKQVIIKSNIISLNKFNQTEYNEKETNIQSFNKKINLNTNDLFLNSLTNIDDITKYYDLDELYELGIDNGLLDGLSYLEKPKILSKRKEYK